VTEVAEELDADRLTVEFTATRQTGGVAITGTGEFLVPRNADQRGASAADRP
jgi:hypothetical protein